MFVYSGKLNWRSSAKNETFVIVFPNGPVRTGDSVYLFSQWTRDSYGVEKKNWFENLPVGKVAKNSNFEDTFTLTSSEYTFTVTIQKAYGSLSVNMAHHHWYPTLFKDSEIIKFERVWQPAEHHPTGSTRIWTGKIKWREFAKNELAMFILPDGVGEGKPVLSIWQWTKSSAQKEKDFQFRHAAQKVQSGTDNDIVKFTFNSYYDIDCTWNQKTERLVVNMKEGDYSEKIGEMSLAVLIDRHSHHFVPPRPASVEKKELEVRLPQAQSSLPRVLTPLPFPDDIVQSLAQTVAFADHAGYLAKYAQDRFNALDADFHARGQQLDTLKNQNSRLDETIKQLGGKVTAGETKADNLAKSLANAQAAAHSKEHELNEKIRGLEDRLAKGAKHDKEDHDLLQKTRKALDTERSHCGKLTQDLEKSKMNNSVFEARLKTAMTDFISLQGTLQALQTKYNVEKKHSADLHAANCYLEKEKHDLEHKLASMQLKLDAADKLHQKSLKDLKAKDELLLKEKAKVTGLEKQHDAVASERDAAVKDRDTTKTEAATNLGFYKHEVEVKEQIKNERDAAIKEAEKNLNTATKNHERYMATKVDVLEARREWEAKDAELTALQETKDAELKALEETKDKELAALRSTKDKELKHKHDELTKKQKEIFKLRTFRDEYEELLIDNNIPYTKYPTEETNDTTPKAATTVKVTAIAV